MRAQTLGIALLLLIGSGLAFVLESYSLLVLSLAALTATVGVGLNILLGLSGQISLGHIGFYAIGAYTSALLAMRGMPLGLAAALGGLLSAFIGGLLALPALRVRGSYLAMVTISFAFIVHHGLIEWRDLTGGANGLMGIPTPSFGPLDPGIGLALCAVWLAGASLWGFTVLRRGRWGRLLRAVKDSEIAAQSVGIAPVYSKALAFGLSALLAGLAGGLVPPLIVFVSPETFPFNQSILFLLAVIVGGIGTVFGPLLGAAVVVLLPELLSGAAEYRLLFFAALLLAVLWAAPKGIIGSLARFWGKPEPLLPPRHVDRRRLARYLDRSHGAEKGLVVKDIGIRFGGVTAAEGVSFEAPFGQVTSIIGPNGAGKSTVLNMVGGFYAPDRGSIRLDGELAGLAAWKVARAGIARTYQTTQLFGEMTVLENLLVAQQRGRFGSWWRDDGAEAREIALDLLSLVGYRGPVNIPAADLPHVDRRLVEIARALATRPRVLLLDEPAAGLMRADKEQLGELLRTIAGYGIAVILVEHDMSLVMSVSDRVLVLDTGKPLAFGTPDEVRRLPEVIGAYLGATDYQARPRAEPWRGSRDATLFVKDLTLDYGAAPVVEDVGLHVNPGELIAILGANGAGKSTLLRALAGLHRPVRGSVVLNNESIETLDAGAIARRGLVLVPEGRQLFPRLSVRDNILLGTYGRRDPVGKGELDAVLERFPRLKDRLYSPAGLLSGGEQQMVAVARGLMAKPSILLLDEPSLGLAPAMIAELYDVIAQLRDDGVTILLVDQMANLALTVADRAYVLEQGRVVRADTAAALRNDPALEAAYLGSQEKVA